MNRFISKNLKTYFGLIIFLFGSTNVFLLADEIPRTLLDGDEVTGFLQEETGLDKYQFNLEQLSRVTMELTSSEFPPSIEILGRGTNANDYSPTAFHPLEVKTILLPGEYIVFIRSNAHNRGGSYKLLANIKPLNDDLVNEGVIDIGQTLLGYLEPYEDNQYLIRTEEYSNILISVDSDTFSPLITLTGNNVNISDDYKGDGDRSFIKTILPPGDYGFRVDACGSASGGIYKISITQPEDIGQYQDSGEVQLGDLVFGQMREGGPLKYRLIVDDPNLYSIRATSTSADTFLRLTGNDLRIEDDNSGQDTNSFIEIAIQPGEYDLEIFDLNNTDGIIRLEITQGIGAAC